MQPNEPDRELDRPTTAVPQRDDGVERCSYCGSRLSPFYYFCLGCGTPHKDVESVLPAPRPRELSEGELVKLKAPSVAPVFWTYFTVVVCCQIIAYLFLREDRHDLAFIMVDVAILGTTCVVAAIYWRSLAAQLRRFGFLHWAAYAGLLLLGGALGINWLLSRALSGVDGDPLSELREAGLDRVTLILSICVLPALTEEIAFRGLVQHWLQTALRPWRAVAVASFLFAILHFSWVGLPYLFAVGVLLGWVKWRTGSLYPSILIHFLHNFAVIELF